MNITSYNITDVSYHYIGLRVLNGIPSMAKRGEQIEAISSSVLKFASDRALRLMLPEPTGTFKTVGEKICQELAHFQFAHSKSGRYELTQEGEEALFLLNTQQFTALRQLMVRVHLQTYDNLRVVVRTHLENGPILSPIVTTESLARTYDYAQKLLEPAFGKDAGIIAAKVLNSLPRKSPSRIEDALRAKILEQRMPAQNMRTALFRAMSDRLVSLRLLNKPRVAFGGCEFDKTYSPCILDSPQYPWYELLKVPLAHGQFYEFYFCEPDMAKKDHQELLLKAMYKAFSALPLVSGYYDIPDLRDWVCEHLMIPEAAFDDGINRLLDRTPPILSVGLHYDRITSHRKPLVRTGETAQLHNLIRRF